ncbi:uncharacterized protein LOC123532398 isoform X1 [Mercenaria mercenaria]|uniref:uncharacterized protein LOC123532398 isoform X1 n=1 Tax=Mercenaria mercenaria TaxID=6596 RepID=UPI00234E9BE0|nr:uncharacterized protein LOC123532398 isoform X1 [Mercenaria mercenaria]
MNAKLKRLIDHKEKAIDEIVMYLHYLQGNDLAGLIRAFCGESEWTLTESFKFAARDPETVSLPKNVCHPDKLIQLIKGEMNALLNKNRTNNDNTNDISNEKETDENMKSSKNQKVIKGPVSQKSLAVKTIADNGIVLVPAMGAFMVNGSNDKKYSVTIFPKETCSCPATSRCYHIIAAMMSVGMPIPDEKKVFNLTQLRKNCRPKHSKKCGTKKGRKGDNDNDTIINPAPDSVVKVFNGGNIFETPNSESVQQAKLGFEISTPKSILKRTASKSPKSTLRKRKLKFEESDNIKIPRLETDLSYINEDNEFIELELSRDDSVSEGTAAGNSEMWLSDLGLTITDKEDLINNKKLNSNHMEAVNKLLRKHVGDSVGGLQLTEKVPIFNDTENRWLTKVHMEPVQSPSCQIHHTHSDHWVASVYHENIVYLLDTLGNDRNIERIIPNGLKIQLSQIYGQNKDVLKVQIPTVMKQNNIGEYFGLYPSYRFF